MKLYPDMRGKPSRNGVFTKEALLDNWKLDKGLVLKQLMIEDKDRSKYGYLPYIATASRASLGTLLASSFCERVNSAAKIVLYDKNLNLSEDEVSRLTMLRMNRPFIRYMRATYPELTLEELQRRYPVKE